MALQIACTALWNSHDRLRSPTLARTGIYDPSYTACVCTTLWRVHVPVFRPMCAPPPLMLCVFLPELFSDCRSKSVLVLQAASLVLTCKCRSLQLPAEAIQPAVTPECTALAILVHALRVVPSYMRMRMRITCTQRALKPQPARRSHFRQQDAHLPDPCAALTSQAT